MSEFRTFNEHAGVRTHGNPLSLPSGSAITCENFEITRDAAYNTEMGTSSGLTAAVYSKVRGRISAGYTFTPALTGNIDQLLQYKNNILVHSPDTNYLYANINGGLGIFFLENFGMLSIMLGNVNTYITPDSLFLIEGIETSQSLFFTTNDGIKKLSVLTTHNNVTTDAGLPKGISFDLRIINITGNWLPTASSVSYRYTWSRYDINNNKIVGAPSERQDIINSSGADRAIYIKVPIVDDITSLASLGDYYLEVYRSSIVASTTIPPEDFQLVYRQKIVSTDSSNGYVEFYDILPDGFRGTALYTNTAQEGISQANDRPPIAKTITTYKGITFYGNVKSIQRLYSSLIGTSGFTAGVSTITISDGTNTKTIGCYAEISSKAVVTTSSHGGLIQVECTGHGYSTNDWVQIVGIVGTTEANGVWKITKIDNDKFDLVGSTFVNAYVSGGTVYQYENISSSPRFILYSSGTPSQNIENTVRSLVKTINIHNGSLWRAYYNSNYSDPPGKFYITGLSLSSIRFYIYGNSDATSTMFSPRLPNSGTTYGSVADIFQNGLMYSKKDQPEAVPTANILFVGSADDPIQKIIGLKDSLFIFKQKDGVSRLTGETASSFYISVFDDTVKIMQKNSFAKGQNSIFGFSSLGFVSVTDAGVEVIGRAIEKDTLKPIYNTNFATTGYGWFNEVEKSYYCSTQSNQNSTDNDVVWVWNNFTQTWRKEIHGVYTNDTNIRAGIVISDLMYYAPLTGNGILKERKSYNVADFYSPDISVTINSVDSVNLTATLAAAIVIPLYSKLTKGAFTGEIQAIDATGKILTLDSVTGLTAGAATVKPGIVSKLKYQGCHCGLPEWEKDFQKLLIYFDNDETSILNATIRTYTDLVSTPVDTTIDATTPVTDSFLTLIPGESNRASKLYIEVDHIRPGENLAICGYSVVYEPIDTRTKIS